ncbi:transposable element Tcb2 transposase [Trichonephila clavipes]|nr:transposable element Tcb2 transposase [Trichonephila clavipes]
MSTMSQRSHLTDSEAWRVVGRLEGGQTQDEVAQAIGVSQRQGRRRATTPNEDRYLVLTARRHRNMNATLLQQHLRSATGTTVSTQTVRNRLHGVGMYARRPLVCVRLTSRHRRDRRDVRFGGAGVLVYGGISIDGRTYLYIIRDRPLTAHRYRDGILRPIVVPYAEAIRDDFILMDDNCRTHRANLVEDFLFEERIVQMEWPTCSPDMNPIEHVWDALGRRVADRQPPPQTLQEPERALLEEWDRIPQLVISSLIDSMPQSKTHLSFERSGVDQPRTPPFQKSGQKKQAAETGEIARHTTQATGRPISRFTVARRLHGGGLFARRPVRCVPLTPAHRRRRSLWCRKHWNWRDNEWERVLFADESRFSLSRDSHRILIWRERGSRNHPSNIIERDRYGGRGVLVWGGIMLGSRTDLHIFDAGSVNGTRYCNEILLPYVRLFRGAMCLQILFMDDNAPCHRTVAAEQLLESEDIERMDWPARSPDLNPIEHVWDFLGRRLAARTLPPVTIRELRLALQNEWAAMPQQLIDILILSMGSRCETCLAVRGDYIPY